MLQGLKPVNFINLIGTTEVVPFYKADAREFFRTLLKLGRTEFQVRLPAAG
jgi:hypothetical protein